METVSHSSESTVESHAEWCTTLRGPAITFLNLKASEKHLRSKGSLDILLRYPLLTGAETRVFLS
jgi:hypothetical protein